MSDLLEINELTTGFGSNQVLHGVTLHLGAHSAGVLLGLNGAGKSVTLKTVSGLQPAWGGSVRFEGRELLGLDTEDRVRAGLGHVLQNKSVFPYLTVAENLRLGGATLRDRGRYRANLDRVFSIYPPLAERADQLAGKLSGGEQAMLAVARALMADPRLLLVDEPSAGLSPRMVHQLADTLQQVRRTGTALLLVEQNVGFGMELADEVFVLEKGQVVYHGESAALDRDRIAALLGIGGLLEDGAQGPRLGGKASGKTQRRSSTAAGAKTPKRPTPRVS